MTLSVASNTIKIDGNIKTISDYAEIRDAVNSLINSSTINIEVTNSISITSSVIGLLMKAVKKDGITINLSVDDEGLYNLLDDLNLIQIFNVRKV